MDFSMRLLRPTGFSFAGVEFKKLVTDDVSPLMPEELMKVIKETPRDAEVIEMLKRFSGVEPLPPR